jgi:hypothetical protein
VNSATEKSPASIPAYPTGARFPLVLFLVLRIIFTGLGVVLYLGGRTPTEDPISGGYFGVAPRLQGVDGAVLGVWLRFDAVHYTRIASGGYSSDDLTAFFPLYPALTRLAGLALGGDFLLGALIVSNLACLLLLRELDIWLQEEGIPEATRQLSQILILVFPAGFFLLAPYSESTFLLLTIMGLRRARDGRWFTSAACGLAAGLTRVTGVVLVLPWLMEALRPSAPGATTRRQRILLSLSPLAGTAVFLVWTAARGFPTSLEVHETYWHEAPAPPWVPLAATFSRIAAGQVGWIELVGLATVCLMAYLGVAMIRRLPASWTVYHWSTLLLGLSVLRPPQPLATQTRFAVVLFPAFVTAALLLRGGRLRLAAVAVSFSLVLFFAGQFLLGGWVG